MAKKATPKRQPERRVKATSNGKHPGGRPRWEPTALERAKIEVAAAMGWKQDQIARAIGVSIDSLERHCRKELDAGADAANLKVGGALYAKAMKGDTGAIIWWEKTRGGMADRTRHEFDLTRLSDEELDQLERIRSRASQP